MLKIQQLKGNTQAHVEGVAVLNANVKGVLWNEHAPQLAAKVWLRGQEEEKRWAGLVTVLDDGSLNVFGSTTTAAASKGKKKTSKFGRNKKKSGQCSARTV